MKTRLNLTIDNSILTHIKAYAANKNVSVSELVEHYFKRITKSGKSKNVVQLMDKLDKPAIDINVDLKEAFYQNQSGKYGL